MVLCPLLLWHVDPRWLSSRNCFYEKKNYTDALSLVISSLDYYTILFPHLPFYHSFLLENIQSTVNQGSENASHRSLVKRNGHSIRRPGLSYCKGTVDYFRPDKLQPVYISWSTLTILPFSLNPLIGLCFLLHQIQYFHPHLHSPTMSLHHTSLISSFPNHILLVGWNYIYQFRILWFPVMVVTDCHLFFIYLSSWLHSEVGEDHCALSTDEELRHKDTCPRPYRKCVAEQEVEHRLLSSRLPSLFYWWVLSFTLMEN